MGINPNAGDGVEHNYTIDGRHDAEDLVSDAEHTGQEAGKAFAHIAADCGLPAGALNIVTGTGAEAGAALAAGGFQVDFDPHIFLLLFIPPLLFLDGWRIPKDAFFRDMKPIQSLAIGLVMVTILGIGLFIHWLIPAITVAAGFALAAILSPTDPVAVSAMTASSPLPSRMAHILEGESLLNDASGLVAFNFAIAAVLTGSFSPGEAVMKFFLMAFGGILSGLVVVWVTGKCNNFLVRRTREEPAIQILISLLIPFAAYLVAEEIEASGVIAIVIAAVEMSSRSAMTAEDRLTGHSFWETVELLFTGVAFGLIGMSVRDALDTAGTHIWQAVQVGVVLSAVAFAVRFAWMFVLYKINQNMHHTNVSPLRMQEVLLMAWAGMRGLVTLALVLSIPASATGYHHELSVIALTVLTCTMVVPGLLLPWLVDKLDLQNGPGGDKAVEELNQRAWAAARKAVKQHGEEFAPEAYAMVQEWLDSIAEKRLQDPEGSEERKQAFKRARAGALQMQEVHVVLVVVEDVLDQLAPGEGLVRAPRQGGQQVELRAR